jgi:hypothetical protein
MELRNWFNSLASTALLCYGVLRHVFFLVKKSCLEPISSYTLGLGSFHVNRYALHFKIILVIILISSASYGVSPSFINMNTGQVSPLMECRTDFAKYNSSCRTVENMFVKVHGSAERRPGTYYVATQDILVEETIITDAVIGTFISVGINDSGEYVIANARPTAPPGTEYFTYLSPNSASTWSLTSPDGVIVPGTTVRVDDDGSFLLMATNRSAVNNIYTSDDSGVTWDIRLDAGDGNSWDSADISSDGSSIVAVADRVFTSVNSGVDWTEKQPDGDSDHIWKQAASDSDGSNLIVVSQFNFGAAHGRVYTSDDAGDTWTRRNPTGVEAELRWISCDSDSDGSNLIVGMQSTQGRIYTSDDSASTWTERRPEGDVNRTWNSVASDSDGSNLIVASQTTGLWTSADSGSTWTERKPDGTANDGWETVASNGDGSVLAGIRSPTGGGVLDSAMFVSIDSGVTWTEKETLSIATTEIVESTDPADNPVVRLVPFEISTDDSYIIEAGKNYFRFYKDDGQ